MKAITIERRTPIDLTVPCRTWTGSKNDDGYGYLEIKGQREYVHRLSYRLHVGPIYRDCQIDHLCRVHDCYEPAHLESVTNRENTMRGNHPLVVRSRQTHCKRGHDQRDRINVYVRPDGRSRCRPCSLMTQRERRRQQCA